MRTNTTRSRTKIFYLHRIIIIIIHNLYNQEESYRINYKITKVSPKISSPIFFHHLHHQSMLYDIFYISIATVVS